jgi:3',5'-cyclic AMP phosphodiesterase CpdA
MSAIPLEAAGGGKFDPITQLEAILKNWKPKQRIDLHGVVVDYMFRSGMSLYDVLKLNHGIYEEIFIRGSKEDQLNLLRSVLHSEDEFARLSGLCAASYPIVADRTQEVYPSRPGAGAGGVLEVLGALELLKRSDGRTVIWQLSDIHFGRFNVWLNDPKELGAAFGHALGLQPELKPDFVVVSGDVASKASDEEFRAFIQFCGYLGENLWGGACPQRILVVPGNHDTKWLEGGVSDRLARFAELVTAANCCITPFGDSLSSFSDPVVEVRRYGTGSDTTAPFAVVKIQDAALEIVLLVSAYYSGVVPAELRELVVGEITDASLRDKIIEHVRRDSGAISMEYLALLSKSLSATNLARIAVTHHHLVQYGAECCQNRLGFALLRTLFTKGIRVVLHGHVHMFEGRETLRTEIPELAYCIPCSTLSSQTWRGNPGFMVHVISNGGDRELRSFTWERSAGEFFGGDMLRPAYLAKLTGDRVAVLRPV